MQPKLRDLHHGPSIRAPRKLVIAGCAQAVQPEHTTPPKEEISCHSSRLRAHCDEELDAFSFWALDKKGLTLASLGTSPLMALPCPWFGAMAGVT